MRKVIPVALAASLILLFVAINVYASQLFHPLLYKILNTSQTQVYQDSVRQFLSYIENTPEYDQQFAYFNRIYGNVFAAEAIDEEFSLNNELEKYESALEQTGQTREHAPPRILVKIALVYLDRGDIVKAREYYNQARAIDPWIEVDELKDL